VSDSNDRRLEQDPELEDYFKRESDVSRRYRELEADDVSPQLDAAVMAQARAAIEPRKRTPTWMKWAAPLALAASAVMAIAIVLEVGVEDEVRMPAPQVERTTKASAARQGDVSTKLEPAPEAASIPPQSAIRQAPIAAPAPAAPAPPSADFSREKVETAQFASGTVDAAQTDEQVTNVPRGASPSTAVTRAAAPAAPAPAPALAKAQAPRLPAEAWLEQIRALRREGKVLEADQQWREFRESYPQFEVSATDLARPKP
jgi:hypothetical protein